MEISSDCSGHAVEKHMERDLPRKCGGDDMEDESAAAQFADDCFNCNICLDFVVEPVVTLCGHLYCWPCIYRWLQVDSPAVRQCPVCKAPLSLRTLVPLYGRGDVRSSAKETEPEIPRRSSLPHHAMIDSILAPRSSSGANQERGDAHLIHELVRPLALLHHQHADYYTGYVPASPIFRSTAGGVLGDLATFILPWASRGGHDHEASMLQAGPRVAGRRQLQMESCLNQLWLFLFCCVLLCLLFF